MTSALVYPHPQPIGVGTAMTVAPGVVWVRMPLPFQLNHINLWLLEDGDGWTMVDTGLANDQTRALWESLFASALGGKPVTRLICTHFHPDHMGLAGWLTERWGIEMWTTQAEWAVGRMLSIDHTEAYIDGQVAFYRLCGMDDAHLKAVRERGNPYSGRVVPIPVQFHRVHDGDDIIIGGRAWRVITGTGHAVEHAALYCDALKILISGDQVLPRISPVVAVWPNEPMADPLGEFLRSLQRYRPLPADTLVLPSHNLPFTGLHTRLDELSHHHDQRLAETLDACAQPATAADVLKRLFTRELDIHQTLFAVGESLAHVHYLMAQGRITAARREDGVWLYRAVGQVSR